MNMCVVCCRHDGHGMARRVQPPPVGAPRAAAAPLPGAAAPPAARLRLLADTLT